MPLDLPDDEYQQIVNFSDQLKTSSFLKRHRERVLEQGRRDTEEYLKHLGVVTRPVNPVSRPWKGPKVTTVTERRIVKGDGSTTP